MALAPRPVIAGGLEPIIVFIIEVAVAITAVIVVVSVVSEVAYRRGVVTSHAAALVVCTVAALCACFAIAPRVVAEETSEVWLVVDVIKVSHT